MIHLKSPRLISCLFIGIISLNAHASTVATDPNLVAHFPMEVSGNAITELVSGNSYVVQNNFNRPESMPGANGNALRLDGYSTFCNARSTRARIAMATSENGNPP